MIVKDEIYLSKHDAQAIFGKGVYPAYDLLLFWFAEVTEAKRMMLLPHVGFLWVTCKAYTCYRSDEVCAYVRAKINEMLDDIYREGPEVRPLDDLKHLFSPVWAHRNLKSLDELEALSSHQRFF